jgi:hypothetical protein
MSFGNGMQIAGCGVAFCFGKTVRTGAFGSVGKTTRHHWLWDHGGRACRQTETPCYWQTSLGILISPRRFTGRVRHWDGHYFIVLTEIRQAYNASHSICIELTPSVTLFIQKLSLRTGATKGEERISNSAGHQAKDHVNNRQPPIG